MSRDNRWRLGGLTLLFLLQGICFCHAACRDEEHLPGSAAVIAAEAHSHCHAHHHDPNCLRLMRSKLLYALSASDASPDMVPAAPAATAEFLRPVGFAPVAVKPPPVAAAPPLPPSFLRQHAFRC